MKLRYAVPGYSLPYHGSKIFGSSPCSIDPDGRCPFRLSSDAPVCGHRTPRPGRSQRIVDAHAGSLLKGHLWGLRVHRSSQWSTVLPPVDAPEHPGRGFRRPLQLRTGVSSGNFVWYCQDTQLYTTKTYQGCGVLTLFFHAAHFAGCSGRANVGGEPTDTASNLQGPAQDRDYKGCDSQCRAARGGAKTLAIQGERVKAYKRKTRFDRAASL